MSWDVLLIKTETNCETMDEISSTVPFDRKNFINTIKARFPDTDCTDDSWLFLHTQEYSVEFNLGDENPVQTVILHVRGDVEPSGVISYLCDKLGCRAIDSSSGDFILPGRKTAFQEWKEYRDRIVGRGNLEQ